MAMSSRWGLKRRAYLSMLFIIEAMATVNKGRRAYEGSSDAVNLCRSLFNNVSTSTLPLARGSI